MPDVPHSTPRRPMTLAKGCGCMTQSRAEDVSTFPKLQSSNGGLCAWPIDVMTESLLAPIFLIIVSFWSKTVNIHLTFPSGLNNSIKAGQGLSCHLATSALIALHGAAFHVIGCPEKIWMDLTLKLPRFWLDLRSWQSEQLPTHTNTKIPFPHNFFCAPLKISRLHRKLRERLPPNLRRRETRARLQQLGIQVTSY